MQLLLSRLASDHPRQSESVLREAVLRAQETGLSDEETVRCYQEEPPLLREIKEELYAASLLREECSLAEWAAEEEWDVEYEDLHAHGFLSVYQEAEWEEALKESEEAGAHALHHAIAYQVLRSAPSLPDAELHWWLQGLGQTIREEAREEKDPERAGRMRGMLQHLSPQAIRAALPEAKARAALQQRRLREEQEERAQEEKRRSYAGAGWREGDRDEEGEALLAAHSEHRWALRALQLEGRDTTPYPLPERDGEETVSRYLRRLLLVAAEAATDRVHLRRSGDSELDVRLLALLLTHLEVAARQKVALALERGETEAAGDLFLRGYQELTEALRNRPDLAWLLHALRTESERLERETKRIPTLQLPESWRSFQESRADFGIPEEEMAPLRLQVERVAHGIQAKQGESLFQLSASEPHQEALRILQELRQKAEESHPGALWVREALHALATARSVHPHPVLRETVAEALLQDPGLSETQLLGLIPYLNDRLFLPLLLHPAATPAVWQAALSLPEGKNSQPNAAVRAVISVESRARADLPAALLEAIWRKYPRDSFVCGQLLLLQATPIALQREILLGIPRWEPGLIFHVRNRDELRLDPELRPLLVRHGGGAILPFLLDDRRPEEFRPLMRLLFRYDPELASRGFEQWGIPAGSDWGREDFLPFLSAGGVIAERAIRALAQLSLPAPPLAAPEKPPRTR